MFLEVLKKYLIFNNFRITVTLERKFVVSQINIITIFFVVSSVGIKRVYCMYIVTDQPLTECFQLNLPFK